MGVFIVFWRLLLGILGDTRAHSYRGGWLGLSKCYELNRKMGRGIVEEAMENSLFFVREACAGAYLFLWCHPHCSLCSVSSFCWPLKTVSIEVCDIHA